MAYQTLTDYAGNATTTDLGTTFYYVNSIIPFTNIVILFPLFVIILLSTYFATKRATGRGDFFASLVSASFINVIASTILTLTTPPLCSVTTLITGIGIFIASIVILFMTRE